VFVPSWFEAMEPVWNVAHHHSQLHTVATASVLYFRMGRFGNKFVTVPCI